MFIDLSNLFFGPFGLVLHVPLNKVLGDIFLFGNLIEQLLTGFGHKRFHFGYLLQLLYFLLLLELIFLFLPLHHLVVKLFLPLFCTGIWITLFLDLLKLSILLLYFQPPLLLRLLVLL